MSLAYNSTGKLECIIVNEIARMGIYEFIIYWSIFCVGVLLTIALGWYLRKSAESRIISKNEEQFTKEKK